LRVVTADIDSYQRLIDGLIEAEIDIDRYFTYFVIKTIKNADFPLEMAEAVTP